MSSKIAIISGASRGIGNQTAWRLAEHGYDLVLVDKDADELKDLQTRVGLELGRQALVFVGDLVDPVFWKEVMSDTVSKWGRIDVLVNNAAWRTIETMHTITLDDWDKTLRINLTAPAFMAKYAADIMMNQANGGVIINVSSVMSQRTAGYSPAYAACKGGLESLTYELAACYGRQKIRVLAVNPGNVQTDMSDDYQDDKGNNVSAQLATEMENMTPLGRSATADEVAKLIRWLVSDEASFMTGTTILADGGFSHNFNSYSSKRLQFPDKF